jgi:hypothetical protein
LHQQVKYRNNVVEAAHGKLKQLIRSVRGFKTLKIVCAPIFNITRDIGGRGTHRGARLWSRRLRDRRSRSFRQ